MGMVGFCPVPLHAIAV